MITIEQLKEKGALSAQVSMFVQKYPAGSAGIIDVALTCGPAWTALAFLTADQLAKFAKRVLEDTAYLEMERRKAVCDYRKSLASNPNSDRTESRGALQLRLNAAFSNPEAAMAEWVDYYYHCG